MKISKVIKAVLFISGLIATLYLSYGFSRILSTAIDGVPAEGLVQSTALEIVIGLVCVFFLTKYHGKQKEYA